ncbi:MAG: CheY-specific phosphatase CheX [Planctomycetota bacterium]|jgi:CheY-specific phosphatase CheX
MAGVKPPPVGATRFYSTHRDISVIVGLCGQQSGSMTLNISTAAMLYLTGKLLFEEQTEVSEENFDAICEIGNMIAGCTKEALSENGFNVTNISVPSLILGANYSVYYTRGVETVSVEFELEEIPVTFQQDRFFSATVSLLRQVA